MRRIETSLRLDTALRAYSTVEGEALDGRDGSALRRDEAPSTLRLGNDSMSIDARGRAKYYDQGAL